MTRNLNQLKKGLVIGISALTLLGFSGFVGDNVLGNNIQARHIVRIRHKTRRHRKIHKHVRRHRRISRKHHIKKSYSKKRNRHGSISNQMTNQSLKDINKDRTSYGIAPVKETQSLNRLAGVRAKQLIHNFSHYNNNGQLYYRLDAKKMHINLAHYYHNRYTSGENIANASMNHGNIVGTFMPNDSKEYSNHNGRDMANMDNDSMLNYDSGSNWGHRKNILNRQFSSVGIGVAHKGATYYLSEDFDS